MTDSSLTAEQNLTGFKIVPDKNGGYNVVSEWNDAVLPYITVEFLDLDGDGKEWIHWECKHCDERVSSEVAYDKSRNSYLTEAAAMRGSPATSTTVLPTAGTEWTFLVRAEANCGKGRSLAGRAATTFLK